MVGGDVETKTRFYATPYDLFEASCARIESVPESATDDPLPTYREHHKKPMVAIRNSNSFEANTQV